MLASGVDVVLLEVLPKPAATGPAALTRRHLMPLSVKSAKTGNPSSLLLAVARLKLCTST
jgi:hypothetical protein